MDLKVKNKKYNKYPNPLTSVTIPDSVTEFDKDALPP
jgi:hypothetical protein